MERDRVVDFEGGLRPSLVAGSVKEGLEMRVDFVPKERVDWRVRGRDEAVLVVLRGGILVGTDEEDVDELSCKVNSMIRITAMVMVSNE